MPNCKSVFVTEAERKHVRRRARFQKHGDASCHQVFFFFPARQGVEGNSRHSDRKLGEHAPSYATVKSWVVQFKRGYFSSSNAPRPGRPKTLNTPEIIDQIHELILEDRRISVKSIAEQLGISRERVGSIHEDLDMRKLSVKWVPKCLNADQKRQRCQSSEQLLEFFRPDPNDFLSRLVTMVETWLYHYDPETKQQSMDWRHSGSPRPPKKCECKNPLEKFSPRFFWGSRRSSSLIIFQRTTLSTRSISGHLQPGRNWPTWACNVLITTLFSGSGPVGLPPVPGTEKTIERSPFFVRRGVIAAAETWLDGQHSEIFLSRLQKLEQRAEKCIELRGGYVE